MPQESGRETETRERGKKGGRAEEERRDSDDVCMLIDLSVDIKQTFQREIDCTRTLMRGRLCKIDRLKIG